MSEEKKIENIFKETVTGDVLMGISRNWSTRPRETVHSTVEFGPTLHDDGPLNKNT